MLRGRQFWKNLERKEYDTYKKFEGLENIR